MESFLEFDVSHGPNLHITHVEDLSFTEEGTAKAIRILALLGDVLTTGKVAPKLAISTKWDGSPAIVFGPDPQDGRFFVATKSAFNITPKLAKTVDDIKTMYPESLWPVLTVALAELPKLKSQFVLQGDVLFIKDTLKHDGLVASFRPNTLEYRTQQPNKGLLDAAIGVALHTVYEWPSGGSFMQFGPSLVTVHNLRPAPLGPMAFANLLQTDAVYLINALRDDISGEVTFTTDEAYEFQLAFQRLLEANHADIAYGFLESDTRRTLMSRFLNSCIKGFPGCTFTDHGYTEQLLMWLEQQKENEAQKRKTLAGQTSARRRYVDHMHYVYEYRTEMTNWFALHMALTNVKLLVIRKLEGQKTAEFDAFAPSRSGALEPTGPEGFVVTWNGYSVKLVDRQVFSRQNFLSSQNR